jgi:hypothetical protein
VQRDYATIAAKRFYPMLTGIRAEEAGSDVFQLALPFENWWVKQRKRSGIYIYSKFSIGESMNSN